MRERERERERDSLISYYGGDIYIERGRIMNNYGNERESEAAIPEPEGSQVVLILW